MFTVFVYFLNGQQQGSFCGPFGDELKALRFAEDWKKNLPLMGAMVLPIY